MYWSVVGRCRWAVQRVGCRSHPCGRPPSHPWGGVEYSPVAQPEEGKLISLSQLSALILSLSPEDMDKVSPENMDKVREFLGSSCHGLESLVFEHRAGEEPSFFEAFILKGIKVEEIRSGFISCSFRVPPRLTVRPPRLSLSLSLSDGVLWRPGTIFFILRS